MTWLELLAAVADAEQLNGISFDLYEVHVSPVDDEDLASDAIVQGVEPDLYFRQLWIYR